MWVVIKFGNSFYEKVIIRGKLLLVYDPSKVKKGKNRAANPIKTWEIYLRKPCKIRE